VYIGTDVANLHHLVRDHELPGSGCLFYPFPAIRDELSWKPAPGPSIHHYLPAEAVNDLSSFPVCSVRDALVDTYFKDIHPGFPIVDEANFRKRYEDPDSPPALIVFQAMLLAAARITDHPQVAASREITTAILFKRAKALFDLRHEHDRVDLIQAALLMAWYMESSDTVASNAYYWVGSAVRIAFGMGLHRTASLRYVPGNRRRFDRKYKKIWWTLLYSEVMLALEYGRPSLIRIDDFDVGILEEDDFKNMDDSDDHAVNGRFCSILGDISVVALDILSLRAPRGRPVHLNTSVIERQLAAVAMRILPTHDVWSCQLRLIYNLVALAFHRTSNDEGAAKLCSEAASNILTTFEAMVVYGTIRQCHLSTTTALTAAAIEFAREARSAAATGSIIKAVSAHGQLQRLLGPAEALSPYFPHIKAVCKLCKSLSARAEVLIKESQEPNSTLPNSQLPPETSIDWEGIMTNYRMPNLGFEMDLEGEEWLHDFSWANVEPSYNGTDEQ
jgi:transcriptional regulatory protein AMDR